MNIVCLIPARGGSKRFPRKNLALLNNKPLIEYSIEQWNQSRYFTESAFVTTEDEEIAKVARELGCQIIKRPSVFAQDNTPTLPVLLHAVNHIERYYSKRVHWVLLLQPTSPLRSVEDIDNAIYIIERNEADSLTSTCPDSKYDTKENGAIYITHANWINAGKILWQRPYYFEMPADRSVDIDYPEDLERAQQIMEAEIEPPKPKRGRPKKKRGRPKKK